MPYGIKLTVDYSLPADVIEAAIQSLRMLEDPPREFSATINGQSRNVTLELVIDVFTKGRVAIFSVHLDTHAEQLAVFGFACNDKSDATWRPLESAWRATAAANSLSNPQLLLAMELLQQHVEHVEQEDQRTDLLLTRRARSLETSLAERLDVEAGLREILGPEGEET